MTEEKQQVRRNQGGEKPVVLITGASRGLGAAAAHAAADLGARVVLTARSAGALQEQAQRIRSGGGECLVVTGDLLVEEDVRRMVERSVDGWGRLDAVVNNAGVLEPIARIAEAPIDAWERNIQVNLLGPFVLTRFAIPHLRMTGGRVVNVSTGAAVKVTVGWSAYSAAKAALNLFTRYLAEEEPDITSVALRPGAVETEMQRKIREEGQSGMQEEKYTRYVRLHREQKLLPPEKPGKSMAVLALYAPVAWSGEFIAWDEDRVLALVREHFAYNG